MNRGLLVTLACGVGFLLLASSRVSLTTAKTPASDEESLDASQLVDNRQGSRPHHGKAAVLSRPSELSVAEFERELFPFLESREYVSLGWAVDKSVRDTGPFIDETYYGTHPAVRIYYSPGVIRWLKNGRKGVIPDGAVIVKEQYPPPAVRHQGKSEAELRASLESWTVMVKDSKGSHDGWFWSNPSAKPEVADNKQYPFDPPKSGFGLYCVRCHAATQSPVEEASNARNEFTFASLRNIEGFPGEPILFRVDDSWLKQKESVKRKPEAETGSKQELQKSAAESAGNVNQEEIKRHGKASGSHPACTSRDGVEICKTRRNSAFHSFFDSINPQTRGEVDSIPPITHDWVVQNADASQEFLTSNQCMSCHAGLMKPFGPTMFVPTGDAAEYGDPGWNVSPYGEWRWTPMGLAGRDPVFLAQLESELTRLKNEFSAEEGKELSETVTHTCFRCHGVMGHYQHAVDQQREERFGSQHHLSIPAAHDRARGKLSENESENRQKAEYGALARDGVSCMVCHRASRLPQPKEDDRPYLKHFLENCITGRLHYGKRGEIYGPFEDKEIRPYVMHHASGLTPKQGDYLSSSQMCGTCHTVSLPAVDKPLKLSRAGDRDALRESTEHELIAGETEPLFKKYHHHLEQATYLEWLNSEYQDEFDPTNPQAKTCQDCHMSQGLFDSANGLAIGTLESRIAIIQDSTYPDAEHLTSVDNLSISVRKTGYRRHNFSGLNAFLVEMFNQHNDILGVRKTDYMTGSKQDIEHAMENFVLTAKEKTAEIELSAQIENPRTIRANVIVRNKAGHRFPSGVGFRRAFIELIVRKKSAIDPSGEILWASGRTNELGIIVDREGNPLPEEFFTRDAAGKQSYHLHRNKITSETQAQVYETLLQDNRGDFTISFIHGCTRVKDNRLLPRGWSASGPNPEALTGAYLRATYAGQQAQHDPRYTDGSGSDETQYVITLPEGVKPSEVAIEATLYYQAIPPYYLKKLFDASPTGPATKRLHFLCANLDLSKTPIRGWKLPLVSTKTAVSSQ